MAQTVSDNAGQSRYEVYDGDALAGFAEYELDGDHISFTHTETDQAFAGRGLASELVRSALDDARRRSLAVLPYCPFVKRFIQEHPEHLDLVPEDRRSEFQLGA